MMAKKTKKTGLNQLISMFMKCVENHPKWEAVDGKHENYNRVPHSIERNIIQYLHKMF